jgi:hypothetical protein
VLGYTSVWGLLIVNMAKFEGLVSLSLRVSSRIIRPERVLHFMFCFQR